MRVTSSLLIKGHVLLQDNMMSLIASSLNKMRKDNTLKHKTAADFELPEKSMICLNIMDNQRSIIFQKITRNMFKRFYID